MPSRKQRRRELKAKRHEYEFVYVDGEGNELDELPEGFEEEPKKERANGAQRLEAAAKGAAAARGGRRARRRCRRGTARSSAAACSASSSSSLFSFTAKGHCASVMPLALLYTVLFVPFTYYIDRFAYRRWRGAAAAAERAG